MTETAIVQHQEESAALARVTDTGISIEEIVSRVEKIKEVQRRVMRVDQHYGVIPGAPKPTLLKPGAELLCMTFQLDPQFSLTEHRDGEHLEVVVTCTLYHAPTGKRLGSGIGSCSTRESKYAYRTGKRVCPSCNAESISKSKWGGGWYCNKKAGGCGAKFDKGDKAIEGQEVGRVANPDLADQYNTVRKMACKRAHVAAVLFVTCASELFTQDLEDMPRDDGPEARPAHGNGSKASGSKPKPAAQPKGPDAAKLFASLLDRINAAESMEELEALVPELKTVRERRQLPGDKYQALRAAYAERSKELASDDDHDEPEDRPDIM